MSAMNEHDLTELENELLQDPGLLEALRAHEAVDHEADEHIVSECFFCSIVHGVQLLLRAGTFYEEQDEDDEDSWSISDVVYELTANVKDSLEMSGQVALAQRFLALLQLGLAAVVHNELTKLEEENPNEPTE